MAIQLLQRCAGEKRKVEGVAVLRSYEIGRSSLGAHNESSDGVTTINQLGATRRIFFGQGLVQRQAPNLRARLGFITGNRRISFLSKHPEKFLRHGREEFSPIIDN